MNEIKVESCSYNTSTHTLYNDIAEFLNVVWAKSSNQDNIPSHRKELSALSFYCYNDNKLVGYAAVLHMEIFHCGHNFKIAGLSCVATHPDYRGCGIGKKIVSKATQYIETNDEIDFAIFTCHPDLAKFYKRAGDWDISRDVTLVGSHDFEALSSKSLDVVVLMRLFSKKAKDYESLLYSEPISLDFPIGEFL